MSGIVSKNLGRASGIVGAGDIGADAVDSANIADDAIDSEHYTDGSIDNAHIADDAIDSEHYADGSIDNAHIADDAIDSEHYADGSIDNAHIADDAIDSEHYAAGSIDEAHIADNAVTLAKMAGGTDGNIISFDASGNPVAIATGNDGQVLTSTGAGSPPAFEDSGGGGKVLQMVVGTTAAIASTTNQIPADDTIPQNDEGIEVVTRAITPSSSSSYLQIDYWMSYARSVNDAGFMALFVDTTANAIAVSSQQGSTNLYVMFGTYTVASASTSARTYKLRGGASPGGAGTFYQNQAHTVGRWFGGIANCGIRVTEIEA